MTVAAVTDVDWEASDRDCAKPVRVSASASGWGWVEEPPLCVVAVPVEDSNAGSDEPFCFCFDLAADRGLAGCSTAFDAAAVAETELSSVTVMLFPQKSAVAAAELAVLTNGLTGALRALLPELEVAGTGAADRLWLGSGRLMLEIRVEGRMRYTALALRAAGLAECTKSDSPEPCMRK